jgi:hypothetical protein
MTTTWRGWRAVACCDAPAGKGKITAAIQANVDAILRKERGIKAALANAQREAQLLLDEDVALMK